jgi:uncharacterized protein (DUF433 family)
MNQELLNRITINSEIFGGKPIIRNIRMKVTDIIDMLASGMTNEEILEDFPYLELEDIQATLMFASLKLNHPTLHAA